MKGNSPLAWLGLGLILNYFFFIKKIKELLVFVVKDMKIVKYL